MRHLYFLLHVVFPPFLQCCFSHVTFEITSQHWKGGGEGSAWVLHGFLSRVTRLGMFCTRSFLYTDSLLIKPASSSLWSCVFLGLNHQFPSEFTFYALDPWYFFEEMLNTLILISCFVFNSLPGLSVHADYHTLINDDFLSCAGLILKLIALVCQ